MSQRRAVLLDLDGTLIDLNPEPVELEQLRNEIFRLLSNAGVEVGEKGIFSMYQRIVTECGFYHPISKCVRNDLDTFEARWAHSRSIIKDGVQHISELRRRGYVLALVTSNGRACVRALFRGNKLRSGWFDFLVTRDDSPLLKPSPMPLDRACRLARERSPDLSRIWFVGDSKRDQQATEAFNCCSGSKLTFVRIGPPSQGASQTQSYASLDAFFRELLTEEVAV
jgi:phosphoglycolate phosphatase-like HAD superfamily hydrolase